MATQVIIAIDTTTDAFHEDPMRGVRNVLRTMMLKGGPYHDQPLLDINGNTVGVVTVAEEEVTP